KNPVLALTIWTDQRPSDLASIQNLACLPPRSTRNHWPTVVGITHHGRPIIEGQPVAVNPTNLRLPGHSANRSVCREQLLPHSNLLDGRPSGRDRNRCLQRQSLALDHPHGLPG